MERAVFRSVGHHVKCFLGGNAQVCIISGVFCQLVCQVPVLVQAILGTLGQKVICFLGGNAKLFHHGIDAPDALVYVNIKGITHQKGGFRGFLQLFIRKARLLLHG